MPWPPRVHALVACTLIAAIANVSHAQSGRIPIALPGQNRNASPFDLAIGRGDQALRRGEFDAARVQFEDAARLNPRDARPPFYLGEVALRQSQWPAAEARFREAIRLNPNMAEAHAELGTALREQNRNADAVAPLEAAIRLDPALGEAHFTLAMTLEDAHQTERAITEYRAAVRLSPDAPMPALNLGILLAASHPAAGTSQRAEAFRLLQSAVRNANGERAVFANAGPALRLLGEHVLAADVLERARAQGTPTSALLAELAQALWAAGNQPVAIQRIGEAITVEPRRADFRYVRGLMLAQQGNAAAATADLRQVVQLAAGTPLAQRAQQALTRVQAVPPHR